ncbi:aldehyde dehydrogenase family protein [Microbacterium sp. CFH 90308]|uniref:Aldehyde dehydrogenase family protein n=1 Tax=Microbacterium salsuginis TaxID=2722803 RepID=A0ABX1K9A1_9MICO|nr:aldehyde dehydrogenase family protein [Microbacterium sp. CFH 90308]NLP83582.1 aldehyde dehydrogenase family protein [Microbacterium sp. CFH 90308]
MTMIDDMTDGAVVGHLIAGVRSAGDRRFAVRNPSRVEDVVGMVAEGTAADAGAAVDAAAEAAASWAAASVPERVARLRRIADAVDAHADHLIDLATRENGSIVSTIRREVAAAAESFRLVADYLPASLQSRTVAGASAGEEVRIERRPYGVVACIVPWNAPVLLTANKLAPAIAAGNAVVLKPSPFAPLAVTLLAALAAAELPAGVVNVVNGDAEIARALVDSPRVRKVSFTGGGATARHIMRQAADSLLPVHFELGGNDPAVVLEDADLRETADRIALSAFRRAGQVCFATKRVYVPRAIADEFRRLLVERVDRMVVGNAADERASMGPVNNEGQFERVRGLLERTRAAGRDVRVLGSKLDESTWADGHFLLPALVLDAQHDDEVVREEQFGPILPVVVCEDEEQAIAFANDTEYGLCSSVWSSSHERALAAAERIEAGVTFINSAMFSEAGTREIPMGGWKQSGIGWEGSPYGIDEYLQFHSIDVHAVTPRSTV